MQSRCLPEVMITPTPGRVNRKRSLRPASDTTSAHTILLEVVEMFCKIIYARNPHESWLPDTTGTVVLDSLHMHYQLAGYEKPISYGRKRERTASCSSIGQSTHTRRCGVVSQGAKAWVEGYISMALGQVAARRVHVRIINFEY